jgi:uncharacterized protein (TIGR02453 family)
MTPSATVTGKSTATAAGTFSGFPTEALDFYEDLEDDNSKTFWAAHKHIYDEQVKAPIVALMAALEPEFGIAKIFRPYRDVRFARDKTPYKTHQGAVCGERDGAGALYLHIGAAGLFVAGGYYSTNSDQIARYRRAVDDDVAGAELIRAIAAVKKAGFAISGDQLTRVPSGYAKDHPRADLLRHRTLTAARDYGCPAWLSTPKAKNEIIKAWRALTPLNSWLSTQVGASNLPSR